MNENSTLVSAIKWLLPCLLLLAGVGRADGPAPDGIGSGTLLMRMQSGYRVATLVDTDVGITVNGLVARVTVRQRFENAGNEWAEAIYVFPLPEKAAVDRMRLVVGERIIESEIRERSEARKAYDEAKAAGKRTSLVEQERPNLFTTSVANVAPGDAVTVEIEYLEDVEYRDGWFSMRFPLTQTPRYIPATPLLLRQGSGRAPDTEKVPDASRVTPPVVDRSASHRVSIAITLNAGVRLDRITSSYHAVDVRENRGRYDVRLASERVPADRDFELVWAPVPSAAPRAMRFTETIGGASHHLVMVMPPSQRAAVPLPRETIFVIDTSGSMHGDSMSQAKLAVRRALDGLKPGDRFNVIEFDNDARALYPQSADVAPNTLADAAEFVNALEANGGTEMYDALELAFGMRPSTTHLRQIVFVTDGAVGNEDALYSLIETRLGSARLFTVGIGSAPNGWFMRKAAEVGRGSFVLIGSASEVAGRMQRLFEKIESPQVTNLSVDWPSGVTVDAYPSIVPDLYFDEPVVVRAKLSGPLPADAAATVRGDTPAGAWRQHVPLSAGPESAGVGALWARGKIGELMDAVRRSPGSAALRDAIVATALDYGLVTRHTSLVAVDRTPARAAGEALRRDAVPSLLPHGQRMNAILGFPATATGAPAMRLTGLGLLFAALVLLYLMRHWSFIRVAAR